MTQDLGAEVTPPIPPAETRILQEEADRRKLNEIIIKAIKGDKASNDIRKKTHLSDLVRNLHMPYTADYDRNFSGTSSGNTPDRIFDDCSSIMINEYSHAPASDEVGRFADRVSALREELEKDTPDFQKVDDLFSEFLYERLEHFVTTVDQRVQSRTQEGIYDPGDQGIVTESLRQPLIESMSRKKLFLQKTLEDAKKLMQGSEFKARKLARIGYDVGNHTSSELGPVGSQVFYPDNFYIDPGEQRKAVLHEQQALKYRAEQRIAQQRKTRAA